jgi:hypothetical protein
VTHQCCNIIYNVTIASHQTQSKLGVAPGLALGATDAVWMLNRGFGAPFIMFSDCSTGFSMHVQPPAPAVFSSASPGALTPSCVCLVALL